MKKLAFTLAEVLIVIGIIGVVAEMTIPSLMISYRKQAAVTRLRATYSIISQALSLAEEDYGDFNSWNWDPAILNMDSWYETYLKPYMRATKDLDVKAKSNGDYVQFILTNGTVVFMKYNATDRKNVEIQVQVMINGITKRASGKDLFVFFIGGNNLLGKRVPITPYTANLSGTVSRYTLLTDYKFGCNRTSNYKSFCAALIMMDGWEMAKDYPYYN